MKAITNVARLAISLVLFTSFYGFYATAQEATKHSSTSNQTEMKTYLIERDIPNASRLTPLQLKGIAQASCDVLKGMGSKIQWDHSYVTGDKFYCVYKAENEELIREHGLKGKFPIKSIMEISAVISPATAESH